MMATFINIHHLTLILVAHLMYLVGKVNFQPEATVAFSDRVLCAVRCIQPLDPELVRVPAWVELGRLALFEAVDNVINSVSV